jgi:hypothetical protein
VRYKQERFYSQYTVSLHAFCKVASAACQYFSVPTLCVIGLERNLNQQLFSVILSLRSSKAVRFEALATATKRSTDFRFVRRVIWQKCTESAMGLTAYTY